MEFRSSMNIDLPDFDSYQVYFGWVSSYIERDHMQILAYQKCHCTTLLGCSGPGFEIIWHLQMIGNGLTDSWEISKIDATRGEKAGRRVDRIGKNARWF